MNILVKNPDGLIGDFLGTVPAMQYLEKEGNVLVEVHPEAEELLRLAKLKRYHGESIDKTYQLDTSEAFRLAGKRNLYMSQAYMGQIGLQIPNEPPKAELDILKTNEKNGCWIISPFARSLPPDQKWSKEKWQQLVNSLPNEKFIFIGNPKFDDIHYINGKNTIPMFGHSMKALCNIMNNSKGLISLVTGTSHLAFHIGVKNILLTNQGTSGWGVNPDSIKITTSIPNLTVEEVINIINQNG